MSDTNNYLIVTHKHHVDGKGWHVDEFQGTPKEAKLERDRLYAKYDRRSSYDVNSKLIKLDDLDVGKHMKSRAYHIRRADSLITETCNNSGCDNKNKFRAGESWSRIHCSKDCYQETMDKYTTKIWGFNQNRVIDFMIGSFLVLLLITFILLECLYIGG